MESSVDGPTDTERLKKALARKATKLESISDKQWE